MAEPNVPVARRHPETVKVDAFADLQDGWDSYGAPRPTDEAIAASKRLFVCPSVHGGVSFEWDGPDGDTFIIEFGPNGKIAEFYVCANSNEFEWEAPDA